MNRPLAALAVLSVMAAGCTSEFWGGSAAGAGAGVVGTGAAYEIRAKNQMDELNRRHQAGEINDQEYAIRKDQIEKGSVVY
jgi:hypothetical protein